MEQLKVKKESVLSRFSSYGQTKQLFKNLIL